jgi:GEVED domain
LQLRENYLFRITFLKQKNMTKSLSFINQKPWLSKLLFLLVLAMGFIRTGQAQNINTYAFAQSSTLPTNISGTGTVVSTSTAAFQDDNNYPVVTMPFAFTYHGSSFTTLGISANCYVKFGGTTSTSYSPLSAQTNCISLMGADMLGSATGHGIYTQTFGTAPFRSFVIQWTNWGKYSSGLNEFTGQIILYETSNNVEQNYLAAPGTTAFTCQVGLNGALASDFKIRTTTTNWTTTTAGTANTATCTMSATIRPSAGLTFTWSPPTGCLGTPTPGATTSSVALACPAAAFTLGLSGAITSSGFTYQWQSDNGSGYSNIAGATGSTYSAIQSATTSYQCIVTCVNSGLIATSSPISVGMNTYINCYCTSQATSSADEEITNVTFGSLNNSSTCTTLAPGPGSIVSMYSNYKSGPGAPAVAYVELDASVPFSFTQTTCGGNFLNKFYCWIDYNHDGDFLDAGELVYEQPNSVSGSQTVTGFINTPNASYPLGLTAMRVVNVEGTVSGPCTNYTWGETEDYLIDFFWTAICNGTPSPGSTLCTVASACSGTNFTLTLSTPPATSGNIYQWESADDQAFTSNVVSLGTAVNQVTSQTTAKWYRCHVTCTSSGLDAYSTEVFVALNSFYNY